MSKVTQEAYEEAKQNGDSAVIAQAAQYGVIATEALEQVELAPDGSLTDLDDDGYQEPLEQEILEEGAFEQPLPNMPHAENGTGEGVDDDEELPAMTLIRQEREMRERQGALLDETTKERDDALILLQQAKDQLASQPTATATGTPFVSNLKEDDFDTEFDFMKAQLAEVTTAMAEQSSVNPQLENALSRIEGVETRQDADDNVKATQRENDLTRNEFNEFWDKHPDLKPARDFTAIEREYLDFRKRLSDTGLDTRGIDRTMAQLADPTTSSNVETYLKSKDIAVMPDFDKLWETMRVFDFRVGLQIDSVTGERLDIKDNRGNIQVLTTMEDAYGKMNTAKVTASQQRDIWNALNGKINERRQAATQLPVGRTEKIGGGVVLSKADVQATLKMVQDNPRILKTNQDVAARYDAIMSSGKLMG